MYAKDLRDDDQTCGVLADLLRGELAAVETYEQALDKIDGFPDGTRLREIHAEHVYSVNALRSRLAQYTTDIPRSSGAWGTFAKAVEGVAKLFGNSAALKALKEGEEHGLKDYEEGIDDIDATSAELVQNQLIPAQQRHINLLDQLINAVGRV